MLCVHDASKNAVAQRLEQRSFAGRLFFKGPFAPFFVVGWLIAPRESADLAQQLIAQTIQM